MARLSFTLNSHLQTINFNSTVVASLMHSRSPSELQLLRGHTPQME